MSIPQVSVRDIAVSLCFQVYCVGLEATAHFDSAFPCTEYTVRIHIAMRSHYFRVGKQSGSVHGPVIGPRLAATPDRSRYAPDEAKAQGQKSPQ